MITPIQTKFAGYNFRSRTEARYAVLFNTLSIRFEFERQGFALSTGAYLPDFWLPQLCAWFEVKGYEPLQRDYDRAQALADETGHPVLLTDGPPAWLTHCHLMTANSPQRRISLVSLFKRWEYFDADITGAIATAQAARFEFGETPIYQRAAA